MYVTKTFFLCLSVGCHFVYLRMRMEGEMEVNERRKDIDLMKFQNELNSQNSLPSPFSLSLLLFFAFCFAFLNAVHSSGQAAQMRKKRMSDPQNKTTNATMSKRCTVSRGYPRRRSHLDASPSVRSNTSPSLRKGRDATSERREEREGRERENEREERRGIARARAVPKKKGRKNEAGPDPLPKDMVK